MSEILWNIIMPVIYIFEGICINRAFRNFADIKSEKYSVLNYSAGIMWTLYETVSYFITENNNGMDLLLRLVLCTAFITVFSVLITKGNFMQRIFPAVLFISIRELSVLASNCLTGLGDVVVKPITALVINGIIEKEYFPAAITVCYSLFMLAVGFVRIAMIYFTIKSAEKNHNYRQNTKSDITVYIIPVSAGIITSALIKMLLVKTENGYTVLLYSNYPLLYAFIPLLSLTLLSAIMLTFRQCRNTAELQHERSEKIILENQIKQMEISLSETEQLYDNIRSVRHDMKNNITVLKSLLAGKLPEDDEIKQYFEEMRLSVEQLDNRVHTGNAVCDSIISSKFCHAEKIMPGIKLNGDDFIFNDSSHIKSYDIGIILSNGLDNAVEACKRLKDKDPTADIYINLRSFKKRSMFFIEIQNSFDGRLKKDDNTHLPVSSKENPELHGIGLRNIKKCSEKYSGCIDIIVRNNSFTLSVMIKEENHVTEN